MSKNVVVAADRGGYSIRVDERPVATSSALIDVIASGHRLGSADPFRLAEGDGVQLNLTPEDRWDILPAFAPAEELLDRLDEGDSDGSGNVGLFGPPIALGNSVYGAPWAWARSLEEWRLVPSGPGETIVRVGLQFEGSMTGAVVDAGMARLRDSIAVCWLYDDSDGVIDQPIYYGVTDWHRLLSDVVRSAWEGDPICPSCDEDLKGWLINIFIDTDTFTEAEIGRQLEVFWRPCRDHVADTVTLDNINGANWIWRGDTWRQLI